METIACFSGTLPQGYQGSITYRVYLGSLQKLHLVLSCNHEHPSDPSVLLDGKRDQLSSMLAGYLGHVPSEEELLNAVSHMKTEIQFSLHLDGVFAGNVHMPGTKKEMLYEPGRASRGCLIQNHLGENAAITIHVFSVAEEDTEYHLLIEGEKTDVEKN